MSDDISSNQQADDLTLIQKHVDQLGEHFDTVQVFCTRHMPAELDGTAIANRGTGNWHARFGQVREWVIYEEEWIREYARRKSQDD